MIPLFFEFPLPHERRVVVVRFARGPRGMVVHDKLPLLTGFLDLLLEPFMLL